MSVVGRYRVAGNLEVNIPGARLASLRTGEKKKFRSDNQEQDDIDSAGEIER